MSGLSRAHMRQGNHEGCPYVGQARVPSVIPAPERESMHPPPLDSCLRRSGYGGGALGPHPNLPPQTGEGI